MAAVTHYYIYQLLAHSCCIIIFIYSSPGGKLIGCVRIYYCCLLSRGNSRAALRWIKSSINIRSKNILSLEREWRPDYSIDLVRDASNTLQITDLVFIFPANWEMKTRGLSSSHFFFSLRHSASNLTN